MRTAANIETLLAELITASPMIWRIRISTSNSGN